VVARLVTARAIMVLGTASHVGKSVIAAAICRMLANDGVRVAPFKAQNMSLNSAATPDGGEIGRAQAMQAEAARIAPSVDMNPILLKPTSDRSSQVVLLGRACGVQSAADYHERRTLEYVPLVVDAYRRLAETYDVVVLEGAGSPAEINLKATDIVNMRMAAAADARCLLVGDIDRGGVFASLLGTLELLDESERARIAAFAINKFRGDYALLEPGVRAIEKRIDVPCAGVIPWIRDLGLDEEDAVALEDAPTVAKRGWRATAEDPERPLRVAVIALPFLSNATDFAALAAEPAVELAYARTPEDLAHADVAIVPGTKETLADRRWLRERGFDPALGACARRGYLVGICGGLQILGNRIDDPHGVEGGGSDFGLGLLGIDTVLAREKITEPVTIVPRDGAFFGIESHEAGGTGYEIHVGRSIRSADFSPFADVTRRGGECVEDGARSADDRVIGTYVHGLFANDALRHAFVRSTRRRSGLLPPTALAPIARDRDERFERLAAHVRASLSLDALFA
jgi:adenosylcobyric acid synthase